MNLDPAVVNLLLRSAVLFLLAGSMAGLAVGALLVLNPQRIRAVSHILNRWVSTRRLNQALDRSVMVDPWFYRHHRFSGALILLAAVYILYVFSVGLDGKDAVLELSRRFNMSPVIVDWLLDALALSALLGALLAAFVSLFLLLRPSMLKDFEQVSNRWVSLRQGLKPVEVQREGLDEYVFRHSRASGILIMLGSLYILALLTTWIGH
jgi:hypothetical protein